ncbi:hypothetical protein BK131_06345 [Paenibacillus amylolyticus]|uniref:Uncharacterized protein n=1 Tax=Paenibacillus amylolyticus TaxID=1451 RepID=A0A1R1C636_PAEAM|nr:hypothetical protein BK131_06345 [Paenibacillus amylolyticus]
MSIPEVLFNMVSRDVQKIACNPLKDFKLLFCAFHQLVRAFSIGRMIADTFKGIPAKILFVLSA